MLVQMLREGPFWCANDISALLVLEDGVLSVEEALYLADRERDFDPVLGGAVAQRGRLNAVIIQPVVDEVKGVLRRLD